MGIGDMPRKMAVRVFTERKRRLEREVVALPTAEQFRLVADMMDAGDHDSALSVAKLALANLESTRAR